MRRFSKITTTQLARICGVSQGTVDRALHDRGGISEETKERILKVAKEYDYRPNIQSRDQTNSMLIGVVLFDLYNEFFSKLAMSLVNAARTFGYSIVFQFSEKYENNERVALEYFDYIGVDGIVLFSVGSDSEEYKNYLHSLNTPIVLLGNRLFDLPYVGIDDARAMRELTLRISKETPRGKISYFSPVLKKQLHSLNAQRIRVNSFIRTMNELGRDYNIVTDIECLGDCTGIVCPTDHYALQASKHLNYPKDISIAGFDNVSAIRYVPSKILSVEYSTDEIARESVNYVLGRRYLSLINHRLVYNTDKA